MHCGWAAYSSHTSLPLLFFPSCAKPRPYHLINRVIVAKKPTKPTARRVW